MPDDSLPPHPDDDVVSAVLDGEATPDERVHVAGCVVCTTRLTELRAVAAAVATPVPPPPPDVRDAAISAALGVATLAVAAPPRPATARRPLVGLVRRRWAIPALAAAVVLVALGVAVPLLTRDHGGTPLASRAAQEKATAGGSPVTVLDLGAIDETTLRAALAGRFNAGTPNGAPAAAPASPADGATGAAGAAPSPALTPSPAPPPGSVAGDLASVDRCQAELRRQTPSMPPVSFAAAGTWTGTPAVVLAFGGTGDGVTVYVMARDDCRILHFERFRPGS